MTQNEPAFSSLTQLSAGLATGQYTSVGLTRYFLDRINRLNGRAQALSSVYENAAMMQAEGLDLLRQGGVLLSPLHGLPVAVKDIFELAGHETTAGSSLWRGRISQTTAAVVERLRAAGMIVVGKTHMPEFSFCGWGINPEMGTPANPWDVTAHRIPGGSSSGSAVAVAAGMLPLCIGSDTGGSVRIPAAFTGLTALKPTYGRISVRGTVPLASALDSVGGLVRNAEDALLITRLLAGTDEADPATQLSVGIPPLPQQLSCTDMKGWRIAVMPPEHYPVPITADVQNALDDMTHLLKQLGAMVEHTSVPVSFMDILEIQGVLTLSQLYHWHQQAAGANRMDWQATDIRRRIERASSYSSLDYLTVCQHRERVVKRFADWLSNYDLLLTPTVPSAAPLLAEVDAQSPAAMSFTRPISYLNACGLSVPAGFSADGLPLGMQFIGGAWQEARLLEAAYACQQASSWHQRTPSGWD